MKNKLMKNKLLMVGYIFNILLSIILPLLSLILLNHYSISAANLMTNTFGFIILFAIVVSILVKSRALYVLNIFSVVMFINAFLKSNFTGQFIHINFVIYALLTVTLLFFELKNPNLIRKIEEASWGE